MEAIIYFIFIQITLFVTGYSFIVASKLFKEHPAIELITGYVTTIVILATLGICYYIFNLPVLAVQIIFWLTFASSVFLFIKFRIYTMLLKHKFILSSFLLMCIFSICFIKLPLANTQHIVPDPKPIEGRNYTTLSTKVINLAQTRANDNYIPYRQAQFMVNHSNPAKDSFIEEWGVHFFQRTPLMGAVTAGFFLTLNDKPPIDYTWSGTAVDSQQTYLKFQLIAQSLNALFIIPAYFLIRKLFNKKAAAISVLFLIPSQFFLYNSFFTWPKSFVAFFILTSWLLLLSSRKGRYTVLAAIASGLAYLAHDLAVLYVGATVFYLLYSKRFKDIVVIMSGSAVFALPWLLTASVLFHRPSSFIYYPISIKDIPQPEQYKEVVSTFLSTSPLKLISIRIESLFYLLTPYQLFFTEGNQNIFTRLWALGLYSIPGSVGIGLFIPLILAVIKYIRKARLWILAITPVVLCVIIIGWPRGLGSLHFAEATVVLLTALSIAYLVATKRSKWLPLAYALNIIQTVYFMAYTYNFTFTAKSLGDYICLSVIIMTMFACGFVIYILTHNQKNYYLNRFREQLIL